MADTSCQWYILQQPDGHCTIAAVPTEPSGNPITPPLPDPALKRWGPYPSQAAAIAKRVGLIRAGHCQPQ